MDQHIVINIDNNFLPQAAAFAVSVMENGRLEVPPVFHVLANRVSVENRLKFSSFIAGLGAVSVFYDLSSLDEILMEKLGRRAETGKFPSTVLARILAAGYLPETVGKYLYADADMIVRKSIADLWSMDLGDAIVGACPEPTIYEGYEKDQGSGRKAYFNAGLLLVDRRKWEKEKITEKCMDWYGENNGQFSFADQDILNAVLCGKICSLPQKFDFFTNYHYQNYASLVKHAPWYRDYVTEAEYEEAQKDPVIIHFAGDERPWYQGNRNPYRDEYRKYLLKTPWMEEKQVEGKEAYMAFYHAVNVLSEKIPGFRSLVSGIYRKTRKD